MFQFFHKHTHPLNGSDQNQTCPGIKLAVSAKWRHGRERLDWILANGLACSFAPNPDQLDEIPSWLMPYVQHGMTVWHHGYFPGKEIGNADPAAAEAAVYLHFKAMEAIQGVGEPLMTIHVGLEQTLPLDHDRVVSNLKRIVAYGEKIGIAISLENLRQGPTADPHTLRKWARLSGAGITLDIGHALSSQCVRQNIISVEEIVDLVADRLMEVHLYESETDRHWAPRNMVSLGPIVDKLITTDCRWWTIELEDTQDVLRTRKLLIDHFEKTQKPLFYRPETEAVCALPA